MSVNLLKPTFACKSCCFTCWVLILWVSALLFLDCCCLPLHGSLFYFAVQNLSVKGKTRLDACLCATNNFKSTLTVHTYIHIYILYMYIYIVKKGVKKKLYIYRIFFSFFSKQPYFLVLLCMSLTATND